MNILGMIANFGKTMIYGVVNIFDSYIVGDVFKRSATTVFYYGLTNLIALPVILMFGAPSIPTWPIALLILASCLIEVLYQFPYYRSLKETDTSIVIAMLSFGQILLPVFAYFILGEQITNFQLIGFFIVILFSMILNLGTEAKSNKKIKLNAAFFLMFIVAFILSFEDVISKKALLETGWVTFMFWYVLLTSCLSAAVYLYPKNRAEIKKSSVVFKKRWKTFIGIEILNQSANMLSRYALAVLPIIAYSVIDGLQPLFVLIFGIIISRLKLFKVHEKIDFKNIGKKIICFGFILLGIYLTVI